MDMCWQSSGGAGRQDDIIVTNVRHYEALTHALDAIQRVQLGMERGISGDFLAQDIRECIFHLSDIVGEVTTDDTLQFIFKHFCVGKWHLMTEPKGLMTGSAMWRFFIQVVPIEYKRLLQEEQMKKLRDKIADM